MQCRVTTLAENTAGVPPTIAEWGFSALVETNAMTVLMDTGEGHGIIHNAHVHGIDITTTDKIVILHGRYAEKDSSNLEVVDKIICFAVFFLPQDGRPKTVNLSKKETES